ncbi:uncharacterized protein EI97DRAFT_203034 [Westerdykella ornata]|uniref:Uncharacterized protein n=1 Tax=Westerdykella ornata TaxID=318751 RepID=A0A6A6J9M2_WESOR|nr:uncharacterized protein EI97DRAFT_203034 [Westerdykella ornata]KAF2272688.1 hypothetical protein EI97DRAFT_203034 [Westerdykella ornata]
MEDGGWMGDGGRGGSFWWELRANRREGRGKGKGGVAPASLSPTRATLAQLPAQVMRAWSSGHGGAARFEHGIVTHFILFCVLDARLLFLFAAVS